MRVVLRGVVADSLVEERIADVQVDVWRMREALLLDILERVMGVVLIPKDMVSVETDIWILKWRSLEQRSRSF